MTDRSVQIADLERKAAEADRMVAKSPFRFDGERFRAIAEEYRRRASDLGPESVSADAGPGVGGS